MRDVGELLELCALGRQGLVLREGKKGVGGTGRGVNGGRGGWGWGATPLAQSSRTAGLGVEVFGGEEEGTFLPKTAGRVTV